MVSSLEIQCTVETVDNVVKQYDFRDRRTIPQVVGTNLRSIRSEYGLTLNDVAKALRTYNLHWSTGRLGDIEAGRGSATVQMVLALSLALSEVCGVPISSLRLLASDAPVLLDGEHLAVKGEVFERLVKGEQSSIDFSTDRPGPTEEELLERAFPSAYAAKKQEDQLSVDWDLADSRAAKRLGMSDQAFQALCFRTWGHLLSVEVQQRADPDASPQKKGRITRELMKDLHAEGGDDGDD